MMKHPLSILSLYIILFSAISCESNSEPQIWIGEAPGGSSYVEINKQGTTILPNGRMIDPLGNTYDIAPHPFGLTLSPDGTTVVTANSGINPISISILSNIQSSEPQIRQIPEGYRTDRGILESVFMGLAVTPDNKQVWVSGSQANKIYLFDIVSGNKTDSVDCSMKPEYESQGKRNIRYGYLGDLVLSKNGETLYIVDQVNFDLLIINTSERKVTHRIRVGRYPFGVALSPDEKEVYVANVGAFEYSPITSVDPDNLVETALKYPPFSYLSEEMIQGIDTDTLKVPGLGDPNVPESFSVWTVDLDNLQQPKVSAKVKTGILVGEIIEGIPAVGGSSPNSLVATEEYIFVSNGNNDCISVISTDDDTVVTNIFLSPDPRMDGLRGMIPFGLALSTDQRRLYVAEAGINAVGIIDIPTMEVIGHLPVGWFPSKLAITPDGGRLIVANAKGYGAGPNGGINFTADERGTYIGSLMNGSVTVLDIPMDGELEAFTEVVVKNNVKFSRPEDPIHDWRRDNPIPLYPGEKESPIKYLVFITKENRTYDQVFGQIGKGRGDSSITQYGYRMRVSNRAGTRVEEKVDVMPNHLALARQFAISDNFYVDGDVSSDGHRWLADTYPNEWGETEVNAAYAGARSQQQGSQAPGNLGITASNGSINPEDYNEAGSIWEHLDRNEISFFNFGGGIMFAPDFTTIVDRAKDKNAGYKYLNNYPLSESLYKNTSRLFPTYNTGIPEQFRVDMFIKEYEERWIDKNGEPAKEEFPHMLFIYYGIDHGAGERPDDGYPFKASYMADNDLALGRTIEYLSNTPYWENMAIFVTEDDAQDGQDHIDAHRSIMMVISPYVKKGHVGHVHYSFGSIFKTFWNIMGIPYLNQYDATATDMAELFTSEPDFTPYKAIPVDPRIFDPETALDPLDEDFNWEAVEVSPILDDVGDFIRDHKARMAKGNP